MSHRLRLTLIVFVCFLTISIVMAQTEQCPALLEQALDEITLNCTGMERNSACYGFNHVDATFNGDTEEGFFSTPADRTELAQLETIQTAPLDVDLTRWGIAVLNVQANIPNTLPGQAVTFILLGDVEVDNAVAPEDAFQASEPVTVITNTASNLRSFPSTNANVVGSAKEAVELSADAQSEDGQWLRVLYQTGPAWINRSLVTSDADLDALAIYTDETRSPMQAFYFQTGTTEPQCTDAPPSTLVVQGPDNVKVDITANGADIRIGSTIGLQLTGDGRMQLFVLSGTAQLGDLVIQQGYTLFLPLNEDGTAPAGEWEGLRAFDPEELTSFTLLQEIEGDFMHYTIELPTLEDLEQLRQLLLESTQTAPPIVPNNTTDNTNTDTTTSGGQPQCDGLAATSPVGSAPFDVVTFYWNPPNSTGSINYTLNIYGADGGLLQSHSTTGTNLTLDVGAFGGGTDFSWQVDANIDNLLTCTTGRVGITRGINPNEPTLPPPGPFCGDAVCDVGERAAGCFTDCVYPVCGDGYYEPSLEGCNDPYECQLENGGC